ncbi:SsgA family sporulation/cell division regulator [Streptomyces sp. HUAS ZL42]|uniref:SsgA family sporulation/cell division regulator n=1 Tax=Streptomyces sp. HUAS ZL42 TaxID=3231715 RepID=UPI00345EBA12
MHVVLEHPTRAHVITRTREIAVSATLRYASTDPLAVHITFPARFSLGGEAVTWTFARTLLEEGLGTPAGIGDVHIWPCGPSHTIVEFASPQGLAMIRFDTTALHRFLLRSYAAVPPGDESLEPALDEGLMSLFGGV